jgi:hypothetical protein
VIYPYFCSHCHKKIQDAADIMLIENALSRPYCSEKCIVSYHSKIVDYFEDLENSIRESNNLFEQDIFSEVFDDNKIVQSLLARPDEVWLDVSDLGEHYYFLFKEIEYKGIRLNLIGISLFYFNKPSMLLFHTITQHQMLLNLYRLGRKVDFSVDNEDSTIVNEDTNQESDSIDKNDSGIDPEILQALEKKKSEYLADFLNIRSHNDIAIEKFHLYEKYTKQVLSEPDEVFKMIDGDQDQILTYVKSFLDKGQIFFYIVVCLKVEEDFRTEQDVLIPIITFPSTDSELYQRYKLGEKISRSLRN